MYKYKSLQAGQLPYEHLFSLQNLLNFIITKSLKLEFHDNLSVCMNEHSSCGLSIIEGIKIYQCDIIKGNGFTKPMEKHPMKFYQGLDSTAQI